jgi:2,5-diketo-D-gluconate reductase A
VVELITLNNGVAMPSVGLGVYQTPPDETVAAVEAAIEVGYRHIDTAAAYGNEREVGEGLRRSGVPREDVFVETKVWVSDYGFDTTLHAFEKSAKKLGVDQIDLLILTTDVMPAVNQIELHPYNTRPDLRAANQAHGSSRRHGRPSAGSGTTGVTPPHL